MKGCGLLNAFRNVPRTPNSRPVFYVAFRPAADSGSDWRGRGEQEPATRSNIFSIRF
ncbi:hypothetical protein AB434_2077 [Heyndrickxia coagulans]|uniref:Uncharacterized protein n=1 Tax=Heyndrickxia coagulans TaxID=1398 RepID=A0AAN0WD30_HEYCO|nr:hypothetical protein SB48_HM08orf05198 [Heyndrickxia coagulans]AKN54482.1 hypothetical protein AB434_2077 [Heyndrickxia coagulans]